MLTTIGAPGPLRPQATMMEIIMSAFIVLLVSLNCGLFFWRRSCGTCPVGTRRATGLAGVIAAIALFCPACALGSIGFFGFTGMLIMIAPYAPLLQMIAIILLLGSTVLLLRQQ